VLIVVFFCSLLHEPTTSELKREMASTTGTSERDLAREEQEPLLGRPGDVTQKPEQGFQWNIVTGTNLGSALDD